MNEIAPNKRLQEPKSNIAAWLTIGLFGGTATGLVAIAWPFIVPAFRRIVLPYVPATPQQIENVVKAIHYRRPLDPKAASTNNNNLNQSSQKLIDLGSGDGRIVIACAQQGFHSHGVELNPWLVMYSKYRAYRDNVHHLTSFQRKNLFHVDLADYDQIIIFGVESMMSLIEDKVRQDCDRRNKSVKLIVCRFPLPNWQPLVTIGSGVDQVWLYKYP